MGIKGIKVRLSRKTFFFLKKQKKFFPFSKGIGKGDKHPLYPPYPPLKAKETTSEPSGRHWSPSGVHSF